MYLVSQEGGMCAAQPRPSSAVPKVDLTQTAAGRWIARSAEGLTCEGLSRREALCRLDATVHDQRVASETDR